MTHLYTRAARVAGVLAVVAVFWLGAQPASAQMMTVQQQAVYRELGRQMVSFLQQIMVFLNEHRDAIADDINGSNSNNDDDDDDNNQSVNRQRDEADEAIDRAEEAIRSARDEVDNERDDNDDENDDDDDDRDNRTDDLDRFDDDIDEAEDLLERARDAFDSRDYRVAESRANQARNRAEDIEDDANDD